MRFLIFFLFFISTSIGGTLAESSDIPTTKHTPILNNFLSRHIKSSSFQVSLYSYKPSLQGLVNTLQTFGIDNVPSAIMPTLSVVLTHTPEIDSRFEIGYWNAELKMPPPTAASLTTTLVPVSYQLIYRPVLLHEYLPIYLGVGFGTLRTSFDGNIVDLLSEAGFSLTNTASTHAGYVIFGFELLQWHSQHADPKRIGHNASINLELKHILKTIETTGTQPLNIVLDGTAIGLSVSSQF